MTEQERKQSQPPTVRLTIDAHKKLKDRQNEIYQATDRHVKIIDLIDWLVQNHLNDFPD